MLSQGPRTVPKSWTHFLQAEMTVFGLGTTLFLALIIMFNVALILSLRLLFRWMSFGFFIPCLNMILNQVLTPWIWRDNVSPKRQEKHLRRITFTNKCTKYDYKGQTLELPHVSEPSRHHQGSSEPKHVAFKTYLTFVILFFFFVLSFMNWIDRKNMARN